MVVVGSPSDPRQRGYGECVPYAYDVETCVGPRLPSWRWQSRGLDRPDCSRDAASGARTALDGAFRDLEAKPAVTHESVHAADSLAALRNRKDAVNVKLGNTGGVLHALDMAMQPDWLGLDVMIGCMVATSPSMPRAILAAQRAGLVDLDVTLLLACDAAGARPCR